MSKGSFGQDWYSKWDEEKGMREDALAEETSNAEKKIPPRTTNIADINEDCVVVFSSGFDGNLSCPQCGCRDIANSGTCPNCEIFIEVIINDLNETE